MYISLLFTESLFFGFKRGLIISQALRYFTKHWTSPIKTVLFFKETILKFYLLEHAATLPRSKQREILFAATLPSGHEVKTSKQTPRSSQNSYSDSSFCLALVFENEDGITLYSFKFWQRIQRTDSIFFDHHPFLAGILNFRLLGSLGSY